MKELIGKFLTMLFKNTLSWRIAKGTDEELEEEYEKRRVENLKNGTGWPTSEMNRIGDELLRRQREKDAAEHPDRKRDPNFRWTDANRWEKD